jgi:hypothetical protein
MTDSPFTCPFCGVISHNSNDVDQRYCGRCHVFVDDVLGASVAVRNAMARFYRKLAEKTPAQADLLTRSAEAWEHGLR